MAVQEGSSGFSRRRSLLFKSLTDAAGRYVTLASVLSSWSFFAVVVAIADTVFAIQSVHVACVRSDDRQVEQRCSLGSQVKGQREAEERNFGDLACEKGGDEADEKPDQQQGCHFQIASPVVTMLPFELHCLSFAVNAAYPARQVAHVPQSA